MNEDEAPTEGSVRAAGLTDDPVQSAFVMGVRMLEAGRASLMLRREGDDVLVIAAAVGISPSEVPRIQVPLGSGIAGTVAQKGMSLLGFIKEQTFLSAPVPTRRGVEGVLNMTERMGGRLYTASDLASSVMVAGHIGVLLEYRRQVHIDFVSKLPNRIAFEEAAERERRRSKREGRRFSVVMLDFDKLKLANDTYGHAKGDELIRAVAAALQKAIREYDFAARWGGDEFVLLLAGSSDGEASIQDRIRAEVARSTEHLGLGPIPISIGVAAYPDDGGSLPALLEAADHRMYADKRTRADKA